MIDEIQREYRATCDYCGEEHKDYFETFGKAVTEIRKLGWKLEKGSKGWYHFCPECAKER